MILPVRDNDPRVHEAMMLRAMDKARAGVALGQTPFGACVVRLGAGGRAEIVSLEHNQVWKTTDITAHAEINAIRSACRKLKRISLADCVIYSTCEPCPMCFSACHWAGLKAVYFGASISDARKAGFNELVISAEKMRTLGKSRLQVVGGISRKENVALMRGWGRQPDKRIY